MEESIHRAGTEALVLPDLPGQFMGHADGGIRQALPDGLCHRRFMVRVLIAVQKRYGDRIDVFLNQLFNQCVQLDLVDGRQNPAVGADAFGQFKPQATRN